MNAQAKVSEAMLERLQLAGRADLATQFSSLRGICCVARPRESPKTTPKPRAGPAFEQHLLVVQQQQPGGVSQRNGPRWSRCRQLVHAVLAPRHAAPPHRADIATRLPCADGRAELHQPLRVDAAV